MNTVEELTDLFKKSSLDDKSIKNEINEIKKIEKILENLCNINIDDNFSIKNNGIIYDLGNDSKIISKIYEIILINQLKKLLDKSKYEYIENDVQNKYPDFIIVSKISKDKYYAVDIKSTYIKTNNKINGFTLGTYKGYFKNRDKTKSIVLPYEKFNKHFCICVIYERLKNKLPIKHIFSREKWQIASKSSGSGNTCNIGSIKEINKLLSNENCFKNEKISTIFG